MDWDHLAEEQGQRFFSAWLQLLSQESPALPLRLASEHRSGDARAINVTNFITGSYNICCTVTFEDGFRVLVRFPILGRSRFRTEKTRNEISVMRFLHEHTKVPIPLILGAGRWGCGPYIVMTFVEGTLLSNQLQGSSSLSPGISGTGIELALREMAHVLLELSKPVFPRIGALTQESGVWKVAKRPLTLNMNELVRVGNLPPGVFAEGSFSTAGEYFQEVAAQQLLHLRYQRNDAMDGEQDCRKRYIARCLFKKIAGIIPVEQLGPFHLYCDDLRPSNVLVSATDSTVTSIIDWEYTYVAPAEFTYTAPWWLLFESPEAWESDLNEFLHRYTPRLQLFLNILRDCEDEQIKLKGMEDSQRLSKKMAQSMENGLFWFCLAARKSYMFDDIYWTFLDQKYFGTGSLDDRLSLLSMEELEELEKLVPMMMQQASENRIEQHLSYDEFVDY
ncbi:phosphotransferase enzyme family protein [Penicillium verhagenii]|uniref:phosphotransferase enzyme family protein n=1 Tax=Penicillium verhagenii TaxID=1562060 RepID=UPI00254534CB|nr:phosphotransferase enzyme family protein [Penicillium verhagenii]KAJ5928334.1 phosphotransferase enzyme family protein [Penicillium verhagenii]